MVSTKSLSLFDNMNQLTPYTVGFDRMFDRLQDYTSNNLTSTNFPPYNIRKDGDYKYVIEMALAGFGKEDIEVELENGILTVRSVKENDADETGEPATDDVGAVHHRDVREAARELEDGEIHRCARVLGWRMAACRLLDLALQVRRGQVAQRQPQIHIAKCRQAADQPDEQPQHTHQQPQHQQQGCHQRDTNENRGRGIFVQQARKQRPDKKHEFWPPSGQKKHQSCSCWLPENRPLAGTISPCT